MNKKSGLMKSNITVVPEPADLTYEFFDVQEKVGICHGNIYENDQPIAYYYSNTFFDTDNDLELHVGLKTGSESFLVLAIKCEKGRVEKYKVVDPESLRWEFNNSLDFNQYTFIKANDKLESEKKQKALSLIKEVLYSDDNIFNYLEGRNPEHSICKIEKCGKEGLVPSDEYPFNYVIWSLQFLALTLVEKEEYIDSDFGEIEVCYERLGTPIEAHLLDCNEYLILGGQWNEWIHSTNYMDRTIEKDFKTLAQYLSQILDDLIFNVSPEKSKIETNYLEFSDALEGVEVKAQKLLDKLGWSERMPIMTSKKMLSEYSWDR